MESNRFSLESHCFLVKGAKRGAIYNLETGDVYSIDEHATQLLDQCENGIDLEEIFKDYAPEIRRSAMHYLEGLEVMSVGKLSVEKVRPEKIKIDFPHPLEFIWLEVTEGCNLKCVHCYSSSLPTLLGQERMAEGDWIRVMKEAYEIGCRKLQFIGGEPFALGNKLLRLIEFAKEIGYEYVEVYTNATLIDDQQIRFLVDNEISIAVSVYAATKEIHEQITNGSGSFEKTISTLRKLIAYKLRTRVGLIAMSINEDYIEETVRFLKEDVGVRSVKVDFIRPSGRGCDSGLSSSKLFEKSVMREPRFPKCTLETFRRAKFGHNCFSKELCITSSGKIYPCIMERDSSYGNVLESPLSNILLNEKAKKIRGLSKDHIEICCDCEYRYCCFDCRPKAKGASVESNILAKPSECLYNPYSGEWGNQGGIDV